MTTDTISKKIVRTVTKMVCMNRPIDNSPLKIENGEFVLRYSGPKDNWKNIAASFYVPDDASVSQADDGFEARWVSHGDRGLGPDGILSQRLEGYEHRPQQITMARLLQRAIEMGDIAELEAGTGSGKSFVYTYIGLAMKLRMVIVCPTIALQEQLWDKDLPFLLSLPEFQYRKAAISLGRSNYVCNYKAKDQMMGSYALPQYEFQSWYDETQDGRIETIPLDLDSSEKAKIAVDDNCLRRGCPVYDACFHRRALAKMMAADVVVTNSAIWTIHTANPWAKLLPAEYDFLVVDEAHMFPDSVRGHLGTSTTRKGIERALRGVEKYDILEDADIELAGFDDEINAFMDGKKDDRIGVQPDKVFEAGLYLSVKMRNMAEKVWSEGVTALTPEDIKRDGDAEKVRNSAKAVQYFSQTTTANNVRIAQKGKSIEFCDEPYDVSDFIATALGRKPVQFRVAQDECTNCRESLSETVAMLHDKALCEPCANRLDVNGDIELIPLADWMARPYEETHVLPYSPAVLLTSATLTSPFPEFQIGGQWPKWKQKSFDMFNRECGISADDTIQISIESPFDYEKNAILYCPTGPEPSQYEEFGYHVADEMERLIGLTDGGAFLLFTSWRSLEKTWDALADVLRHDGYLCLKQGSLSKSETIRRFKEDGDAVLFALKTYWQGVDVQGLGLRNVAIAQIPMQPPTDPVVRAQAMRLEAYARDVLRLKGQGPKYYPLNAQSAPKAAMDLNQGFGRLIRTMDDYGIVSILDSRLMSKAYAKKGIFPSLPNAAFVRRFEQAEMLYQEMVEENRTQNANKVII